MYLPDTALAFSTATCLTRRSARMESAKRMHALAAEHHPDCALCVDGVGTIITGPGHSDVHTGHCSCDRCW